MQAVEIKESLMAEVCEAASFEQQTCSEYVEKALREALRATDYKRREPEMVRRHLESYIKFPQKLDDSDEEWEHWRKVYEQSERGEK